MKPASLLFSKSFYSRAVTSGSSVIILGEVYPLPFGAAWSSGLGVVAISAGGSAEPYFILLGFFAAYLLIFVLLRKNSNYRKKE